MRQVTRVKKINGIVPQYDVATLRLGLLALGLLTGSGAAQTTAERPESVRWSIALHGGAGSRPREMAAQERESLEQALRNALAAGKTILSGGGSALDAVEAVVVLLEDDPQFNAGKGAVFTRAGTHELDASIMDGARLRCGAVAGVKFQKNPIKAARLVMQHSPHVLIAGEGADRFAIQHENERVAQDYFYTPARFRELQEVLKRAGLEPLAKPAYFAEPQPTDSPALEQGGGTVGCVALDVGGNLAAATSTGGLTGKLPGRIGDTPICGAGTYANNNSCAVSATGKGEEYIRHTIAARVAWLMNERQFTVDAAVRHCLNDILQPGDGGIIAVDRHGKVSMHATTSAMARGAADSTGRFKVAIWIDPPASP